jgi:hypothetical protein
MTVTPIVSGPARELDERFWEERAGPPPPRSLGRLPGPAEGTSVGEAAIEFSSRIAGGVCVVPQHLAGSDLLGTADELRTRTCAVGAIRGHKVRLLPQGIILACSAASNSAAAKQGSGPLPVAWHSRNSPHHWAGSQTMGYRRLRSRSLRVGDRDGRGAATVSGPAASTQRKRFAGPQNRTAEGRGRLSGGPAALRGAAIGRRAAHPRIQFQ